jgi:hypothetical protein
LWFVTPLIAGWLSLPGVRHQGLLVQNLSGIVLGLVHGMIHGVFFKRLSFWMTGLSKTVAVESGLVRWMLGCNSRHTNHLPA